MTAKKPNSLYWPDGSQLLYGKKSFDHKAKQKSALSDWVKNYIPSAQQEQKTDAEMIDDLNDRINKLTQLLQEGILSSDETILVRKEIEELNSILGN